MALRRNDDTVHYRRLTVVSRPPQLIDEDPLAPARGVLVGLGLAVVAFWVPLAAAIVWLQK